jgi:hypothetical protein
MDVLLTFGKVDDFGIEQLRKPVRDTRTIAEAVFRAVIVGMVCRALPSGLPGCARRPIIGKVLASIQPHHNTAGLNSVLLQPQCELIW